MKRARNTSPGALNECDEQVEKILQSTGRFMSTNELRAATGLSSSTVHRATHKLNLSRVESTHKGKVLTLYGLPEWPAPAIAGGGMVKRLVTDHTAHALKLARAAGGGLFGQLAWATSNNQQQG